MYWYKKQSHMNILVISLVAASYFTACKPDIKETGGALRYFDIKGFYTIDTAVLRKLNKPVFKTVTHNGVSESKTVPIDNWGQELNFFISSDINKPAWKDSYDITANGEFLIYRAKYPELKMREMIISKNKQKVNWILIFNNSKNILYSTSEKLSYFPDSLYLIEKVQRVRMIGTNYYKVKGIINK